MNRCVIGTELLRNDFHIFLLTYSFLINVHIHLSQLWTKAIVLFIICRCKTVLQLSSLRELVNYLAEKQTDLIGFIPNTQCL